MFSVGEIIVYGTQGVCRINEITEMFIDDSLRSYYVLCPIHDSKSIIYVPTDNESMTAQMRAVLSREAVDSLIDEMISGEVKWIKNDTERKAFCSDVIKRGDRRALMQLIDMLYVHREELRNNKKRFQIADDKYLKEAEKQLNDEFAYILKIPCEQVSEYIISRIKNRCR